MSNLLKHIIVILIGAIIIGVCTNVLILLNTSIPLTFVIGGVFGILYSEITDLIYGDDKDETTD